MNRKQFLKVLVFAAAAKTALTATAGCSSNEVTGSGGGSGGSGGGTGAGGSGGSGGAGGGDSGLTGTGGGAGEACHGPITATSKAMLSGFESGIEAQHPHTLMIPLADITAAALKTYTNGVTGDDHTHSITLTADDFVSLMSGATVDKLTTNLGGDGQAHSHAVRLVCA